MSGNWKSNMAKERDELKAALRVAVKAMEALQDPDGHIFHGPHPWVVCTGECEDIKKALALAKSCGVEAPQ